MLNSQSLSVREAILERRSVGVFNKQPVDAQDILDILNDAVWAPNHKNRQPWRVILGVGEGLPKVLDVIRDVTIPNHKNLSDDEVAHKMTKFLTPGAYAFVVVPEDLRQHERTEDFAAASCFIQNIMLLAWDRGIGSIWKNPTWLDSPEFTEAIGAKPGERVIAMVQLGYFDKIPAKKTRKTAEEIVTFFGE